MEARLAEETQRLFGSLMELKQEHSKWVEVVRLLLAEEELLAAASSDRYFGCSR
jgi:hypothetical protein